MAEEEEVEENGKKININPVINHIHPAEISSLQGEFFYHKRYELGASNMRTFQLSIPLFTNRCFHVE